MSAKPRKLSAKRVATKTYFEYGVSPVTQTTNTLGNYANFVLGVVLVVGIFLIAQAFGV
jgi:hypothetical protein